MEEVSVARLAEGVLRGQKMTNELLQRAGQCACGECSPISDVRACADYRSKIVDVLVQRAAKQAAELARAG